MEASNFLISEALIPAFSNPFLPAFFIPAGVLIPALFNFSAVALPIPGTAINAARGFFFDLPAMSSPIGPYCIHMMNPSLNKGYI